jgi:hypothetical protein
MMGGKEGEERRGGEDLERERRNQEIKNKIKQTEKEKRKTKR